MATKKKADIEAIMATELITPPSTLEEAQETARSWAKKCLERDNIILERDGKIAKLNKAYDNQLEELDAEIDKQFRRMRAFFNKPENVALYMGDKRSCTISHVACALRTSPGKVVLVGKKEADLVQEILDSGNKKQIRDWLSLTPKLDKDSIILDWADPDKQPELANMGIVVTKDQLFSLTDTARDAISNTQKQA